jgi:hypothetical protein
MESNRRNSQDSNALPLSEIIPDQVIDKHDRVEAHPSHIKEESIHLHTTAIGHSYVQFLISAIKLGLLFFLRIVRFCWRHKILTAIVGLATLAKYGQTKVKGNTKRRSHHTF